MNTIPSSNSRIRTTASPSSARRRIRWGAGAGLSLLALGAVGFVLTRGARGSASPAAVAALPQVTVSRPLVRPLATAVGLLGQFSAVDQVELRAQVGGTLTGIHFKDGDIVHRGDLLFTLDAQPYAIKLAQAEAQLETALARRQLADSELHRASELQRSDAGTVENVEQRTADLQAASAAVDAAQAQIRDARFDLDHCRIKAPFTGRIGTHLVSVGNLIAGSRAAASPTTLLATLVSLDPIHLDVDLSETDFQTYGEYRRQRPGQGADRVEVALANEERFTHTGVLDFLDNALDRSSGTLHARATLANTDLRLTPGEFARVRLIVAPAAPTLLVPDAAVLPDQSRHLVLIVGADGKVAPKPVMIGELQQGLRVIRDGLSANDRVVIGGLPGAAPGAKVDVRAGTISPVDVE